MKEKFDQNIARKLRDYESKVPDDMWSRIHQQKPKRRRYVLWPIFLFAGLVAVSGLFYWMSSNALSYEAETTAETTELNQSVDANKNQADTHTQTNSTESNEANATVETEGATSERVSSNRDHSSTVGVSQKSAAINLKNNSNQNNNKNTLIDKNNTNKIERQNKGAASKQEIPVALAGENKVDLVGAHIEQSEKLAQNSNALNNLNDNIQQAPPSNDDGYQRGEVTANNQSAASSNNFNSANIELNNNKQLGLTVDFLRPFAEERSSAIKKLDLPDGSASEIRHMVYDPCSVRGSLKRRRVDCYKFVQQSQYTFADFVIGPQYFSKIRSVKSDADELLAKRNDSESYRLSYHAQARLGVKMPAGLTGMVGVSYDRLNEHLHYYNPEEVRIVTTTTQVTVGGETSTYTTTYQTIGERTVDQTNSMQLISIPVTGGYTWGMDKFDVGLYGGAVFNLLFSKSGKIVDTEGVQPLTEALKRDVYKNNAGISLTGGMIFSYHMDNDFSFIAEPRVAYTLRSLTAENYALDQQHLSLGLNVGIRKRLYEKVTHKKKYGVN